MVKSITKYQTKEEYKLKYINYLKEKKRLTQREKSILHNIDLYIDLFYDKIIQNNKKINKFINDKLPKKTIFIQRKDKKYRLIIYIMNYLKIHYIVKNYF